MVEFKWLKWGAFKNLCQSGSILTTQGLNDGNTDRYKDNITTHTWG